ncbi:MAG: penicillin acylase family protein [Sediminibacterium sp.]
MRFVYFFLSLSITVALVWALNRQWPLGSIKSPRIGYFLSPQQGFWQNAESASPSFDLAVKSPELKGKVDVYIDQKLVPHVYADNDFDAYFAQGFIHARFRLWQMEFQTHAAAGRLSEILGKEMLNTDRFFRRIGMVYGAEQAMAESEKDSTSKMAIDAYAAGVNAYISSLRPEDIPFEYKLLDYEPEKWTSLKTYLFMMFMAFDLSGRDVTTDLQMTNAKNYFGWDNFRQLYPLVQDSLDPIIPRGTPFSKPVKRPIAPSDVAVRYLSSNDSSIAYSTPDSKFTPKQPDADNGSNNWAVSGSKTKSKAPILCNDPHLGLNLPSLWFEMQLSTPTYNTYGASFPGAPAIVIGFNDSIAWGVTNAGRDVMDLYTVRFKDELKKEYLMNGNWIMSDQRQEMILVKDGANVSELIPITKFGSVLYDKDFNVPDSRGLTVTVKWTATAGNQGIKAFLLLNRAKNFNDYSAAISQWTCPGQNFVFASKAGDIAIKQQGKFIAKWKHQGDFVMPGTDSFYQWQGYIPMQENPFMINPVRGFVSSANQKPVDSTYPYYLGSAGHFPLYRGIIINRKLNEMNGITPEDMMKMQTSNYNVFAEMARPALMKYLDKNALTPNEKKLIGEMENWNLRNDPKERGATIFHCVWDSLESAVWGDEIAASKFSLPWPDSYSLLERMLKGKGDFMADDIRTKGKTETIQDAVMIAVRKAIKHIETLEGAGKVNWSAFKDTYINHLLKLPSFSRLHLGIGGGENIINATKSNHGPGWRMVVHLTAETEAYCVYAGGQSGNPGSVYYDTFVNNWVEGTYNKALFLKREAAASSDQMKWRMSFSN